MASKPDAGERGARIELRAAWRLLAQVWGDYHVVTRALAIVVALCCVLGSVMAFRGVGALESAAGGPGLLRDIEQTLVSDSFRMLLTLVLGLLILVAIKRRQQQGQLDGDEHYTIGRALAFGYFKNFLVGALLLARDQGKVLYVFHPRNVDELHAFEKLWPRIEQAFGSKSLEIDGLLAAGSQPLKRRLLVVSGLRADDTAPAGGEVWFDFPTTLFTIGDYYRSWNRWLESEGRPWIDAEQQRQHEHSQIREFFRHVRLLGTEGAGVRDVAEYGLDAAALAELFEQRLRPLDLDGLLRWLPPAPAAPTSSPA